MVALQILTFVVFFVCSLIKFLDPDPTIETLQEREKLLIVCYFKLQGNEIMGYERLPTSCLKSQCACADGSSCIRPVALVQNEGPLKDL